jgi:peptidoglycan/LPS O-acetylase OafA/YrhL
VLSGYLITKILVSERTAPFLDYLKRFYFRRTLRIFPLYYAYLLSLRLAVSAGLQLRNETPHLWPYLLGYAYNFLRFHGGPGPGGAWVSHLWSLAVEEQFYLVWPVLVYWLSPRAFRGLVIGLIVGTPLMRLALGVWPDALGLKPEDIGPLTYFPLWSQLDAFAWGAAVAVLDWGRLRDPLRWFQTAVGLLLVAGAITLVVARMQGLTMPLSSFGYPIERTSYFQYVWTIPIVCLTTALAVLCAARGQHILRILEVRWLVYIGKISYGVYVLHYALLSYQWKYLLHSSPVVKTAAFLVYLAVLIFISHLSFRFFESRFIAFKDRGIGRPAAVPERG